MLCDNEESGAKRGRLQHVRRIALHNPTVDGEIRVVSTLAFYGVIEHLRGTHIWIDIGGERALPGQSCRPLSCGEHINPRPRCGCIVLSALQCSQRRR